MNNYEYIVASLPILSKDWKNDAPDCEEVVSEIRESLSHSDERLLDILLEGFSDELGEAFYRKALSSGNAFLEKYYRYDLNLRNTKVDYLNAALSRPEGTDRMEISGEEFEEWDEVDAVLARKDLIEREKGLDDLMWTKAEEIAGTDIFTLSFIFSFIVRMKIVGRWTRLDPETGKAYLRTLIDGVRSTYEKIKYTA